MDLLLLACQLGLTAMITGWLVFGLRDNLVYPEQNRLLTDMVLRLDRMEEEYPQFYEQLKHRRIDSPQWQAAFFKLIVGAEVLVTLILLASLAALSGALAGVVAAETAQAWALAGAFGYTMIWSAFLVGGNHFAYWLCFKEQQYTHFYMALWGLGTMIFIVVSG